MHCNCKTSLGTVLPEKPTLVDYPINASFAWTISLAPSMKIKPSDCRPAMPGHKGKEWHRWHELSLPQQWNYYKTYMDDVFGTFGVLHYHAFPEINKAGELHCHCVIKSTGVQWDVAQCRKLCKMHTRIRRLVGKKKLFMRLNYIHQITDPAWVTYIAKDRGYGVLMPVQRI